MIVTDIFLFLLTNIFRRHWYFTRKRIIFQNFPAQILPFSLYIVLFYPVNVFYYMNCTVLVIFSCTFDVCILDNICGLNFITWITIFQLYFIVNFFTKSIIFSIFHLYYLFYTLYWVHLFKFSVIILS